MAQATSMSGTETPMSNYPIAMGADLGIVKAQLKEHMVWMHIGSCIDSELVLQLCKDCLLDIRTIYLGSETVAFIDYVHLQPCQNLCSQRQVPILLVKLESV